MNNDIWIGTDELVKATGISSVGIWKRINNGYYKKYRYVDGLGRGGRKIEIAVSCLPQEIQALIAAKNTSETVACGTADKGVQEIALKRLEVLNFWEQTKAKLPYSVPVSESVRIVTSRYHLSAACLYSWKKKYDKAGVNGLLPSPKLREKRGSYSMPTAAHEYLLALYLDERKRTVAHCFRLLSAKAEIEGWELPSVRTVQRIIGNIPLAVRMAARETSKTVYDKVLPYTQRDHSKILANQVWVGDHFRCDFFVKGKNGKWVRPWLTAWLDMRSRKFVSWQVCENPSSASIIASFAKAALDPAIGLPKEIYIDNGRDYASKEFAGTGHRTRKSTANDLKVKTMLESLQVGVHFALPANGRAKVIEREFRVVAEEICKEFPTWCAARKDDRPENLQKLLKKDSPHMTVTLEEAAEIIGNYLKYVKNKRVSNGRGRKGEYPDQTFEMYRMPYRVAKREVMQLLLTRHSQPLVVRNGQVSFRHRSYYADELVKMYGEKVYIRYNEEDMSAVSIWSMDDKYICEAKAPATLPGIGAEQEDLSAEMKRKGRVKKNLYEDEILKIAKRTKTMETTDVIDVYKKLAADTVEAKQPKVIMPVAIAVGESLPVAPPKANKYENILKFLK